MPHAPRPETGRGTRMSESREHPCPKNSTRRMRTHSHAHALLKEDIYGKNLRTDHPGDRNQTAPHPLPRPPIRRSERGLSRGVAAGENPCRRPHHRPYLGTGPGSRHGLGAQPGIRSFADPCNGFQQGRCPFFPDGIPSGEAAARTPATSTARHGPYVLRVVRLRVRPEHDRVQSCASPSGHPGLSGPLVPPPGSTVTAAPPWSAPHAVGSSGLFRRC